MNCKIIVISASNIGPKEQTSSFCIIKQYAFEKFIIGITEVQNNNSNPVWNSEFNCHLIRGLAFDFKIINKNDKNLLIGHSNLTCFNCKFNEDIELPIHKIIKNDNEKSFLKIRIEQIHDYSIKRIKNPSNRIGINNIVYANLAFSPGFLPTFPIASNKYDFICFPLDISIISFDKYGKVSNISSYSEMLNPKCCCHSKSNLCYCSDTFGPTLRLDLQNLFSTSVRAIIVVSIFNTSINIEQFQWIALDLYISQERHMKRTKKFDLLCNNESQANVFFFSRIPLKYSKGTTMIGVISLTSTQAYYNDNDQFVEIDPVYFSVPNHIFNIPTYSITEIVPELVQTAKFPAVPGIYERRLSCCLGCTASLSRALFINQIQQLQHIDFLFSWKNVNNSKLETEIEIEASSFSLDKSGNIIGVCSLNHQKIFDGALIHNGSSENGKTYIFCNFSKLPPEIEYLCFAATFIKSFDCIKKIEMTMNIGNIILFKALKKKLTSHGIIFLYFKREKNDWVFAPILEQVKGKTPTLIQNNIVHSCKSLFLC